jgi:hypothetical protein
VIDIRKSRSNYSGVPQNSAGKRLLAKCFTQSELEHLQTRPEFQKAVAAIETLQDLEITVTLGHRQLLERDGIIYPNSAITSSRAQT